MTNPTNEEVRGAVLLQECVEMVPELGHPIQYPQEIVIAQAFVVFCFHELSVQIAH